MEIKVGDKFSNMNGATFIVANIQYKESNNYCLLFITDEEYKGTLFYPSYKHDIYNGLYDSLEDLGFAIKDDSFEFFKLNEPKD